MYCFAHDVARDVASLRRPSQIGCNKWVHRDVGGRSFSIETAEQYGEQWLHRGVGGRPFFAPHNKLQNISSVKSVAKTNNVALA